ncbi:MAG: dipeptide epimerase, partial [Planctomycetes bacterium]|nr:dipeptide epimerase [Planctomycetota bacterium]
GSSVSGDGRAIERTIVSVEHNGITGLGEAAPAPFYKQTLDSVEAALANMLPLLGNDPADIDSIVDRLLERFDDDRAAVAAVDAALHDWLGKRENMPVWKMLGLNPAHTAPTSLTIAIDDIALLPQKVREANAFGILKFKVGTKDDVRTLTELRRLAPEKTLRVDANCGWPPEELVARIRELQPFDLELIEQPIPVKQFDAVTKARMESTIPIIADEDSGKPADVEQLSGVYDGINIKLAKCGGIREARRMIATARRLNMKIMLGCMVETSLGISAAAQIASEVDFVDLDGHLLLTDDPFTGLKLERDVVRPSDRPGLGVWESDSCTLDQRRT